MNKTLQGTLTVSLSFILWGFFPIYWKWLEIVPARQILAHRIFWTVGFLAVIISLQHNWPKMIQVCRSWKNITFLFATSLLIAINWLTYIYGVNTNRIVETSLGYFINPLINVVLGVIVLREKMQIWQSIAVFLALCGVVILTMSYGRVPWIALTLAFSFGTYGLLRKIANIDSIIGLTIETSVLFPVTLLAFGFWHVQGELVFFDSGWDIAVLCVGTGIVTAIPLLLYTHGVPYIRYTTTGILQYFAPTLQLLVGTLIYGELFTPIHRISFGLIWAGLLIYSIVSIREYQRDTVKATAPDLEGIFK